MLVFQIGDEQATGLTSTAHPFPWTGTAGALTT
jgi:hypothetical protein